ncbi:MAG: hypothetical protein ACI4OZ_10145 [Akkermansia sp.]
MSKENYVERFASALDYVCCAMRHASDDLKKALDAYRRNRDASTIPPEARPLAGRADMEYASADDAAQQICSLIRDLEGAREELEAIEADMPHSVVTPPETRP